MPSDDGFLRVNKPPDIHVSAGSMNGSAMLESPTRFGSMRGALGSPASMIMAPTEFKESVRDGFVSLGKEMMFLRALIAGILAGLASSLLKALDSESYELELKFLGKNFLETTLPEGVVFNCFIVAISIVASFRTSYGLSRFTEGGSNMHLMASCFYEATSSCFAFTRISNADSFLIDRFEQTLVRLTSLLNACCLEAMEEGDGTVGAGQSFKFELLDMDKLDEEFQEYLLDTENKAEAVFQAIQTLLVDNVANGVLSIAPPILTRAFQELGGGLVKFHDAMRIVREPTPLAYTIVTKAILAASVTFVPLMMAHSTKGIGTAFMFASGFVFAVWFIYGIADSLDNPYAKKSHTLHGPLVQRDLNESLLNLVKQRHRKIPYLKMGREDYKDIATPKITQSTDWKEEARARRQSTVLSNAFANIKEKLKDVLDDDDDESGSQCSARKSNASDDSFSRRREVKPEPKAATKESLHSENSVQKQPSVVSATSGQAAPPGSAPEPRPNSVASTRSQRLRNEAARDSDCPPVAASANVQPPHKVVDINPPGGKARTLKVGASEIKEPELPLVGAVHSEPDLDERERSESEGSELGRNSQSVAPAPGERLLPGRSTSSHSSRLHGGDDRGRTAESSSSREGSKAGRHLAWSPSTDEMDRRRHQN